MALILLGSMLLLVTSLAAASCPEKEAMSNFDLERFFGLWHTVREPDMNWPGWESVKCTHSLMRRSESGTIKSIYMYLNSTSGDYRNMSGSLSRPAGSTTGNFDGIFGDQQISTKYYVLGTDYDNYAVVWLCRPKPNGEEGIIEIPLVMSRHRTLDQAHLDVANNLLPEGAYRDANQSDCPEHDHAGHDHAGHGHAGHGHGGHGHGGHEHGEHGHHH